MPLQRFCQIHVEVLMNFLLIADLKAQKCNFELLGTPFGTKVLHLDESAQIFSITRDGYHRVGDLGYHCLATR